MKNHYGLLAAMLVFATLPSAAQTLTRYDDFTQNQTVMGVIAIYRQPTFLTANLAKDFAVRTMQNYAALKQNRAVLSVPFSLDFCPSRGNLSRGSARTEGRSSGPSSPFSVGVTPASVTTLIFDVDFSCISKETI
jgi:hypothetical protein